jgi:anti-anti-sigma factor
MQATRRTCTANGGDLRIAPDALGLVVSFTGDHDLATQATVHDLLARALDGNGHGDLLIDLTATSFFDATFLGEVATCAAVLEATGCRLTVRTGSHHASSIFEATGLGRFVEPAPEQAAALRRP